jgi:hypothetical protein
VDGVPFEMVLDLFEKLINSFVVELKRIEGDSGCHVRKTLAFFQL